MTSPFEIESIEKIHGSSFVKGNRVEILHNGGESFNAIFKSIEEARSFICLHFYIFRNDETGTRMAELLKKKAREGVRVYILYDHFGSFGTPRTFWNSLKNEGIRVRASRPFKWSSPLHYAQRDHRKLIISDGVKAFTGGLNIADEYRGLHLKVKKEGWRDTGVMIEGPIAYTLFRIFQKTWRLWRGEPIPSIDIPALAGWSEFHLPVIPIFASSSKGRRRMRKLLYYSINSSRKNILLTTAYFTPSRRMLDSLEEAVKRGVDVKLLVPGKSDVLSAYYAGRAFFTRLLRSGVRIFTYQGEVLHAKSYVFDGSWTVVGSANLDFRSLRRNDEGNVGILDEGFGNRMAELFEKDIAHSVELKDETWNRRPLFERIKEWFFALFRRRL